MSAIFPKWTNRLPLMIIVGVLLLGGAVTAGVWYCVRDRNPEALYPAALEGYLWIEVHGRLHHVWEKHVEVREEPV